MPTTVLIVEDEPINRFGYETIVTQAGCSVAGSAGTAVEALRLAGAVAPDLALWILTWALMLTACGSPVSSSIHSTRDIQHARRLYHRQRRSETLGRGVPTGAPVLRKPALPLEIINALQEITALQAL
jgi:CheY-like chemotaxis protein